ncbi:MAG: choice-of-anchor tandem repeat NxxGxxAF-containing protein [Pirellulales bacterium]
MLAELADLFADFRIRITIALAILVSQVFISTARANNYRTVAMVGDQAPGAESGTVFSILQLPILNDAGQVAFFGSMDTGTGGLPTSDDTALWQESAGSLEMVVREGTQAPGAMPGHVFDDFIRGGFDFSSSLALNNAGHVAFDALLKFQPGVTDVDQFGVWVGDTSGLRLVAKTGGQAPGTPVGAVFDEINAPWLDKYGQVAFNASLRYGEGGVTNDNIRGAWIESGGPLSLFSRQGIVGGTTLPSGLELTRGAILGLNSSGRFVAEGSLVTDSAGATEDNNQVFWTNALGSPKIIIREGDQLPGTESGTKFNGGYYLRGISWNDDGEIAFFSGLPGPPEPGSGYADVGLWTENNGLLSLVTRRGGSVPGVPGAEFRNFGSLSSNSEGHVAFSAALRPGVGGVGPFFATTGIWAHDNDGVLRLVARSSSPVPGEVDQIFSNFGSFAINDAGQVAFQASTTAREYGIWVQDIDGTVLPIAIFGQVIDVDNGPGIDLRTIRSARFFGDSVDSRRRYRGFNDRGQLAFVAQFTDGSSGVFVSNVVSIVPEPDAIAIGLFGLILCANSHRLRRKRTM